METKIIDYKNIEDKTQLFLELKKYYINNKVIAIPTETVYGLSADATNFDAVSKIYNAKGRPSDNPLIVHFYKLEQIENIVNIDNENVKKLISNFWPGPMTLILPLKDKNIVAENVTAGLGTLAVRMPSNECARNILKHTELLLAAPSANTSGKPSPTKFEHVYNDLNSKIDVIIKGDSSDIGLESTVIDCTSHPFVIARPGSISKNDIENILGEGFVNYGEYKENNEAPISPGVKYRHYSPDGELSIVDKTLEEMIQFFKDKNEEYGFITYKKYEHLFKGHNIIIKYLADDEESIEQSNKNLYNILREYDTEKVKKIYILSIEENDKTKALVNRLKKASGKKED